MQFKQYPSYKNSGVEWLGGVPEHWSITPLKFAIKNWRNGKWGYDVVEASDDNLVCVRVADFDRQKGVINTEKLTLRNYKGERVSDCLLNENHILIERSGGGENQLVGATVKFSLNIKAVCSNFISLLEIKTNYFDLDFIQYYFDHLYSLNVNKLSIKQTSGIQNLDLKQYVQNHISFPEIFEQTQIVLFLDTETARIDNLISKQEKLIELLEEQRKSIISHAVTKGLNPNAPMKDSGVEWLGEVPEHWEVTRLKNIGKSIIGLTYSPNEICNPDDDSYLVLRSSNVQNGQLSFLDNVYVKSYVSEKLKIKKNDILICSRNGSRDLIGKNTIIKNPPKNSTFGAFMTVYRSEHADYVYWILNSYIFKAQAGSYLTTTVNQLTINNLNNMTVPFAPTSEQNEIVEFLSTENLKFNNLISKQKALIEKLKEYRASIISHAVTGKIDVREFGA